MNNDASESKSEDAPWSPWDEWTCLGEVKSETGTLSAWIREAADGESIEVRAVKSEPSADYIRSDFENDGYSWMPSDLQDGFIQLKIWTKEIAEALESHAEGEDSYIWRKVMFEACSWKFDLGWENLGIRKAEASEPPGLDHATRARSKGRTYTKCDTRPTTAGTVTAISREQNFTACDRKV